MNNIITDNTICAIATGSVTSAIAIIRVSGNEAIKIIDENTFWITSEDEGIGNPFMYKIVVK